MLLGRRRDVYLALLAICASLGVALAPAAPSPRRDIPPSLTDQEFWAMISGFSEPGGFFRSDNFVSNEITWQYVIPELQRTLPQGGVYLGVGPDQNFTYVVALRPRIAFIIDIRRQNMLQHLMYKALIELSPSRNEFLSRLFARPRPASIADAAPPESLFAAYATVLTDSVLARQTLAAIRTQLITQHRFALSDSDLTSLEYVYTAFVAGGPDLTYSFGPMRGGFSGRRMPSYAELMVENDGVGMQRSYLANEENFRTLKDLEWRNLIVPVVGDFGGDKAIRVVGQYVREHRATVTAFYLSNVEQYLFQSDDAWRNFFNNVGTLPVDSSSTFVRAVFNGMGFHSPGPATALSQRSVTLLAAIAEQVQAYRDGRLQSYWDVVQASR